ncbi:MmcQ/YjbR family DNA-binding protein [Phenylobacterium sp.]|uniref:MmcQ/YjbR family DNA-binding protein n=1 Tax=Phenylobacterium sp. TaxID=1871053 RepID=UPI0035643DED
MAGAADLRRIALALPEAYEDVHRRRPAFRVQARIFAMLGVTGNQSLFTSLGWDNVAVVKLDREDQLNMAAAHPDAIQPTETYGHHGWTYLRLENLDGPTLETVLRLAWIHVAPKRLSKAL